MDVLMAVGMFRDGRTGESGGLAVNAGSISFWLVVALILVVIVLYRSMRKHVRGIHFDEAATSDQERMGQRQQNGD
ncbi:hypothetical protein [Phytoactinopolyspora mesophila]|uniref:Uncharacterized protein n=1 Tax=Phytoactinopolyspora mesophila TaxID=2650750 RepID=A0A7K3M965_9ACTN|nr:hypothetical protein [Phytoactinopolyspora mesophila]NDL59824.1 hypothetical protein [Phytoactinopolyspora mesophila]